MNTAKQQIIERIDAVIKTMDTISVSGRKDVGSMYGCMSVLDDIRSMVSAMVVEYPIPTQEEAVEEASVEENQ